MNLAQRFAIPVSLLAVAAMLPVTAARAQSPAPAAEAAGIKPAKTPYFGIEHLTGLERVLRPPPAAGSPEDLADLREVHRLEAQRTPDEVRAARYDDTHEDMFLYADVLQTAEGRSAGASFSAKLLPETHTLSSHLRTDSGWIDNPLKQHFQRLRPYNFDASLHPVCATNTEFSYPSGHAVNGFMYALTLAEMVPEQKDRILARAQEYAHHRVVCGVHYPTDVQASRETALLLFGYLLAQPDFLKELEAARVETRTALGLSAREAR